MTVGTNRNLKAVVLDPASRTKNATEENQYVEMTRWNAKICTVEFSFSLLMQLRIKDGKHKASTLENEYLANKSLIVIPD